MDPHAVGEPEKPAKKRKKDSKETVPVVGKTPAELRREKNREAAKRCRLNRNHKIAALDRENKELKAALEQMKVNFRRAVVHAAGLMQDQAEQQSALNRFCME